MTAEQRPAKPNGFSAQLVNTVPEETVHASYALEGLLIISLGFIDEEFHVDTKSVMGISSRRKSFLS